GLHDRRPVRGGLWTGLPGPVPEPARHRDDHGLTGWRPFPCPAPFDVIPPGSWTSRNAGTSGRDGGAHFHGPRDRLLQHGVLIEREDPPVAHQHPPMHDRGLHIISARGVYELRDRVVHRGLTGGVHAHHDD